MKRYAVYRTSAAPASRKLGSIGLAVAATAFLAKRFGLIDADVFVLSLMVAAVIALGALALAFYAFNRIWARGGPGVPAALTGTVFGLLALGPPALVVGILILRPGAHDLSTDAAQPPEIKLRAIAEDQPFLAWFDDALEQHVWPAFTGAAQDGRLQADRQPARFADIVSRRYRISTAQLHAAGAKALEGLNWQVVDELPPDLLDAATRLQAEGSSQLLGLETDVVLRIRPDPVGALLDVRARSRTPLKDLTGNADHIRSVFAEIDRVLLETYGDLSRLAVDESQVEEEELQPEPAVEPRETIPLPGFKPFFEEEDAPVADGPDQTDLEG
ncbi:DUF1499 domain-containing protein [Roseibium sp. Sym1]|uniref:DUF1499 domain-containing protein n=1 Tax=Roseibium sp. Sym1 TaxID=3016006 RepID=UPI0022B4B136|nr:DUF1499 domain-containing protein [Roseibium sp. Sym1]